MKLNHKLSLVSLAITGLMTSTAFADTSVGIGYTNQGATLNAAHRFTGTPWGVSGAIGLQDKKSNESWRQNVLSPDTGYQDYTANLKTSFGGIATVDWFFVDSGFAQARLRGGIASVSGSGSAANDYTLQGVGHIVRNVNASYSGVVPAIGLGLNGKFGQSNWAWGADVLWLGKAKVSSSHTSNGVWESAGGNANNAAEATLADKLKGKQDGYLVGVWVGYAF
jgi:hypothetical protein